MANKYLSFRLTNKEMSQFQDKQYRNDKSNKKVCCSFLAHDYCVQS